MAYAEIFVTVNCGAERFRTFEALVSKGINITTQTYLDFVYKIERRRYKGERETVRDLRPVSRPRSPSSMDFFFPCKDEVVTDKLRLEDPPWLAISFYCRINKIDFD